MERKEYNRRKKRGSAETPDTAFPKRRYASIDSVESYANQRQGSVDENTLFDANNRRSKRVTRDNTKSTGSSVEVSRFSTDDGFDTMSFTSRKTTKSRSFSRRFNRKTNADKYDVNQHYYAGIAHSDLDIQTGRPPLLFQMNIVEWLWFQSGTAQRVMFMALGALFFLALAHLIFGLYLVIAPHQMHDPYLCHSESCTDLSRRLRKTLDKSVNPCEDFYGFVCGSSDIVHNLTEEENTHWNFGFDVQRVVYDFRYSPTLGRMLKKTRRNPDHLVLDLYQSCLEKRQRNKLDLQPYYKVLQEFGLYDVHIRTALPPANVPISMGKILGHSYLTSAVLKVHFYRGNASAPLRAYVEEAITEPLRTGPTFRFGYKRYYTAVHTAFSTMRNELQVSNQELDVLPHDIICLELFFRDWFTPERVQYVIDDPDNIGHKPCELGNYSGTIKANFGQPPSGPFDFDLLIRTMYSVSNPNWNPQSPKNPFGHDFNDPVQDPRTDTKFVARFSKDFERSAPIRFMRYLQWRVLFAVSTHLSDSVDKFILPVKRHQNLGLITNCFHHLFTWLPFLAPTTFIKNSNTEIKKIIEHFELTAKQTIDMYARRASKSIVKHIENILNKKFTDRQAKIIDRILQVNLRVDTVQPVAFYEANFMHFRKLYEGMEFEYDHFLDNIIKMGRQIHKWKTNPDYSDIYYRINSHYRLPILFDRSRTNYDRVQNLYRIYLPMAVAESPFVNDGLHVSDLSGLGLEFAGNLEKTFYMSLVYEVSQEYLHHQFNTTEFQGSAPVTDDEVDTAEADILEFHGKLKQKFKSQIEEYKFGGKFWNKIRYESAMDQILTTALQDQSRYHAVSLVVNEYLRNPSTHWIEKKSVLHGLEKYNVKMIFYMSLVNRRCDKIGPSKFDQIYEYGPLPQPIIENLALSNLIDFSETFNCPIGSPMNRREKVYFWNNGFDVK